MYSLFYRPKAELSTFLWNQLAPFFFLPKAIIWCRRQFLFASDNNLISPPFSYFVCLPLVRAPTRLQFPGNREQHRGQSKRRRLRWPPLQRSRSQAWSAKPSGVQRCQPPPVPRGYRAETCITGLCRSELLLFFSVVLFCIA